MNRPAAPFRPAFSLAELMIALLILGLGLLFIASALPVGIEYARRNVNLAEAEAAGVEALNTIELAVRTSDGLTLQRQVPGSNPPIWVQTSSRLSMVFEPRVLQAASVPPAPSVPPRLLKHPYYEPIIKVRPFVMRNVSLVNDGGTVRGAHVVDRTEWAIALYLQSLPAVTTATWNPSAAAGFAAPYAPSAASNSMYEIDGTALSAAAVESAAFGLSQNPVFAATARVFPPVEPVTPLRAADFIDGKAIYSHLTPRGLTNTYAPPGGIDIEPLTGGQVIQGRSGVAYGELAKALDRRVGWTAFYRRVSYLRWEAGPNGIWGDPDDVPLLSTNDPQLYELIVVVTQRPSVNHRFALQDVSATGQTTFSAPRAVEPGAATAQFGADRLCPTPWLVTMTAFSPVPSTSAAGRFGGATGTIQILPADPRTRDRILSPTESDRAQLRFTCRPEVGRLCPPGSLLIPARNDYRPSGREGAAPLFKQQAGFVPSTTDSLPIYRVLATEPGANPEVDPWTLVIENNGFYPWVGATGAGSGAVTARLPFWIIPPAFEERDGDDVPLYEDRSPILSVTRRIVRIPEVSDRYVP